MMIKKKMIKKGLRLLRAKGLNPRFFAAPAHGFDLNTLKVLKDINFKCISDGFFAEACIRDGLTWIPLKTLIEAFTPLFFIIWINDLHAFSS